MSPSRYATSEDWQDIRALLEQCDLPLDGAADHLENFLVAFDGERLVACAGLECHDEAALLRSVAVHPHYRGLGLARTLVAELLSSAVRRNMDSVALLTTTAVDYFPRLGFKIVARNSLPAGVTASAEFKGACPDTATAMLWRRRKGED